MNKSMKRLRDDVNDKRPFGSSHGESHDQLQICESGAGASYKPKPTFDDAFSYLKKVEDMFPSQREKYDMFIDVLRNFKRQRIDTVSAIARVKELFKGHPSLLLGFNPFLPKDYEIILNVEDEKKTVGSVITVNSKDTYAKGFTFCEKVKERLQSPTDYQAFLKCLYIHSTETITRNELQCLVAETLGKYPDLMEGFNEFIDRYERVAVLLAKWDEGNTNSKLVKEEEKDKELKCKTEAPPIVNMAHGVDVLRRSSRTVHLPNHLKDFVVPKVIRYART